MAHDISEQISSLNALPRSFWNQLKDSQDGLLEAIDTVTKSQIVDIKEVLSLKGCFQKTLQIEEPTILNIYVPLIRKLREIGTDQALDFYIMVKAHIARIARIIKEFSGDPLIVNQSNSLLARFEKEVQEPAVLIVPPTGKRQVAVRERMQKSKQLGKRRKGSPRSSLALIRSVKIRSGRTKPVIEKVALRRKRAR